MRGTVMTASAEPLAHTRVGPMSRLSALLADPEFVAGAVLTLLAFATYWFTGPEQAGSDSFVPLAEAFIHGRLSIPEDRPWLELIPAPDGGLYTPFPPVPAVILTPFVALMGERTWSTELSSNLTCALLGAASVALAYWLLGRLGVAFRSRQLLTVAFGFTTLWWAAGSAGTHLYAQVTGVFFMLLALHVAIGHSKPVLAGLLLGLAAGSRLPMGLALPLLLAFYGDGWRPTRAQLWLIVGVAAVAMPIAWYNAARFGSPFDFGYARIPSGDDGLVTDEPWFRHGLVSPLYIPRHLYAIFLQSFNWLDAFPFLQPSWTGLSLTLSAPWVFFATRAWSVRRGQPLVPVAFVSVLLVLLPDLMHGSWGFAQFGYRFILDAMPIILLLAAWAYRDRASPWLMAAVALGVVVHAYGIYAIYVMEFVAP
jgi:4-amino-4-deoxy-L-arabinose transferase-like glycosyltransferase